MSSYRTRYPDFPSYLQILTEVSLKDGRLWWLPPNARPVKEHPTIYLFGQHLPLRLVTWVATHGSLPELLLHSFRPDRNTEPASLVEVIPSTASKAAKAACIITADPRGAGVIVRVIPRLRPRYNSIEERIVRRKWFSDYNPAFEWGDHQRGLLDIWRPDRPDKPRLPNGRKQYIHLPAVENADNTTMAETADYEDTPQSYIALVPNNLDMLSHKACERFVGTAVGLCRTIAPNGGYQMNPKDPLLRRGATLTVTLGAYDGAWRCRAITVAEDGTQKEEIRESQPAALLGWSINTTLLVGKTPGKAPEDLRQALLALWRGSPPSQADLRRARASLTPTPIPKLGVDGRTRGASQPTQHAVPLRDPQTDFEATSIPTVLDRLTTTPVPINPKDYIAPGNTQGVQVHIERTAAGFHFTLRGASRQAHNQAKQTGEPNKYEILSRTTIPSPISYQRLREYPNRNAVFTGILTAAGKYTPRLISTISEAITDRLNKEKPPISTPATPEHGFSRATPKPKLYSYSQGRAKGSPRSLKVTITTMVPPPGGGRPQPTQITTYLASAIAMIADEGLSDPTRVVPYYTAHRRIKRGWDPRKAITTPITVRKEPTEDE